MNRNKFLFKNTLIFTIGNFTTRFISFFLVPLYTFTLTTEEYGKVDLVFTICSFVYPLLTLNISEAVFRFSMDKKTDKNKIISCALLCFLGVIVGGLSVFLVPIFDLKLPGMSPFIYLYLISVALSQILLALVKGQQKLRSYTLGNILNSVLVAVLSVLFLLILNLNVKGYFLAYIISGFLTAIFAIIHGQIFKRYSFNLDKKILCKMTKYSVVLIPTSFMWWIINSSDKVMITDMVSVSAAGIYAISYKIPSILTSVSSIFNQAWMFSAITGKKDKDHELYTNSVFSAMLSVLCVAAVLTMPFIRPILSIIVADDFYESWQYAPFLIFGFIFMSASTFISSTYNAHKDSRGLLFSGMSGAIANILLNLLLIPLFGVYGAALATCASYIVVFAYRLVDTRKYLRIHLGRNQLFLILVSLFACGTIFVLDSTIRVVAFTIEILISIYLSRRLIEKIIKAAIGRCKLALRR